MKALRLFVVLFTFIFVLTIKVVERRLITIKLALVLAVIIVSVAYIGPHGFNTVAAKDIFPEVFNIPDGWQPEGIVVGRGTDFFVGSLLTGAVYRGGISSLEKVVIFYDIKKF